MSVAVLCAASTLAVFVSNVASFLVLSGVGLAVRRAFGLRRPLTPADWFVAFWVGFAATIWFLILWNFQFPVNAAALGLVLAAGAIGLWAAQDEVSRLVVAVRSASVGLVLVATAGALWLANLSTAPLRYWDSTLYHLPAIKWAHAYAAVPGIANMYGPLAFNNAGLLYGALHMAGPWGRFSHHAVTSSLVFVLLMQCLIALWSIWKGNHPLSGSVFVVFLLPAVIALTRKDLISSYSTDVSTALVLLAAACAIYDALGHHSVDDDEATYRVVVIAALLALAACLKFGAIVFAGAAWLLVAVFSRWKTILASAAVAAAMGLSWMARGIVLSGYPMFPASAASAPVEWRAPVEHARAEYAYIVHSGRHTSAQLGVDPDIARFTTWFPHWLPRLVREEPFAVLVPGVLALLALLVYLRTRQHSPASSAIPREWLLSIPAIVAIFAWLIVAPEPRYALPFFWILAALCSAQAVRVASSRSRALRLEPLAIAVLFTAASAAGVMAILERPGQTPLEAIVAGNVSRTPIGSETAATTPKLERFETRSGLELWIPLDSDGRCGDAPLLCTPNPAKNLRLRDPRDVGQGFVVEGPWQMEHWPYDWLPRFLASWRASAQAEAGQ